MIGRIGPDYEILNELRRGAWVTVYEARHRVLGRRALVKWLNPEHQGDAELIGRLQREARLGAAVDHPNAARIYGVGEAEGRPYVAMEWIEGEDLETVLDRDEEIDIEWIFKLAFDLLRGLNAIHEAGVVHRDLSPANIRITESKTARITDFGLATGRYDPRYTIPGSVVGTPGYLAPEQASGKEIDSRADLFTCGVLLHETITRKSLFQDKDLISTLKKVKNYSVPLLEEEKYNLPEGFAVWLNRFLEKDPEKRWDSAATALDSLKEILKEKGSDIEDTEQEEIRDSKINLPVTLFPVILGALLLVTILLIIQPFRESPIEPPGIMVDNVNALQNIGLNSKLVIKKKKIDSNEKQPRKQSEWKPISRLKKPKTVRERYVTSLRSRNTASSVDTLVEDVKKDELASEKRTPETNKNATNNRVLRPEVTIKSKERLETVLVINTNPWAEVFIDNIRVGITPGMKPMRVKNGKLQMTFDNPGFPPIVVDTHLVYAETTMVRINLVDFVGTYNLTALPWASINVDDRLIGDTPIGHPVYLAPGDHTLTFEHPDFGIVKKNIYVKKGENRSITVNMVEEGTLFAPSTTEEKNN